MTGIVLLVGCGEIGSRHLQAVASLPDVRQVEIVDQRPEALELGRKRISELPSPNTSITFRWLSSLAEASHGGDLCIVATQADVRCRVVREVAETLGYSKFLLEKLVSQSTADYRSLIRFCEKKQIAAWVNCKGRAHPSHIHVKQHLVPGEPIVFSASGGNHGLVTNGVHVADLFAFYDGAEHIECVWSEIDPVLHQTKRGAYDLSGTLCGRSVRGSTFMLSLAADHVQPALFSIVSPHYRVALDDVNKWIYESCEDSAWKWRPVPFEADLNISSMTRAFAADILSSGRCRLPTLTECFAAHEFILEEVHPHFEKLLGTTVSRSPVT